MFSDNVTVTQAVALRNSLEAMPVKIPLTVQELDEANELRAAWLDLARKTNEPTRSTQ